MNGERQEDVGLDWGTSTSLVGIFEHSHLPGECAADADSTAARRDLATRLEVDPPPRCPACLAERGMHHTFERAATPSTRWLRRLGEERKVARVAERLRSDLADTARLGIQLAPAGGPASAAPAGARSVAAERGRPAPRLWAPLAAAAALLLLVGLLVPLLMAPPRLGDPADGDVLRSAVIEGLAPDAELAEAPLALRCDDVPGAAGYRFRIETGDGTVVVEQTTSSPRLELAELRGALRPFVRYTWSVVAVAEDGDEMARSAPVHFLIAPGGGS